MDSSLAFFSSITSPFYHIRGRGVNPRPIQTAARPSPTLARTYAGARNGAFPCARRCVSCPKAEKVVKPPRMPVITKTSHSGRVSTQGIRRPIRKHPETLIPRVAQGKRLHHGRSRTETPYRRTDPRKPPAPARRTLVTEPPDPGHFRGAEGSIGRRRRVARGLRPYAGV